MRSRLLFLIVIALALLCACQVPTKAVPPPTITATTPAKLNRKAQEAFLATPATRKTACVSTFVLNVRSGPGTQFSITGWLVDGEKVVLLPATTQDGWSFVGYDIDKTGWVNNHYLKGDCQ